MDAVKDTATSVKDKAQDAVESVKDTIGLSGSSSGGGPTTSTQPSSLWTARALALALALADWREV